MPPFPALAAQNRNRAAPATPRNKPCPRQCIADEREVERPHSVRLCAVCRAASLAASQHPIRVWLLPWPLSLFRTRRPLRLCFPSDSLLSGSESRGPSPEQPLCESECACHRRESDL